MSAPQTERSWSDRSNCGPMSSSASCQPGGARPPFNGARRASRRSRRRSKADDGLVLVRCRTRRPGRAPSRTRGPGPPAATSAGGTRRGRSRSRRGSSRGRRSASGGPAGRTTATSACRAGRWFPAAVSSTSSVLPRRSDARSHQARSGCSRRERVGEELHVRFATSADDGDEQVVERAEVVVQLEAGLGFDTARGHRGIAVADHDPLGGVEKSLPLLGGRGSGLSGDRHRLGLPDRRRPHGDDAMTDACQHADLVLS